MLLSDKPIIKYRNDLIEINHGRRFPFKKSFALYAFLIIAFVGSLFLPFSLLFISIVSVIVLLILFMFTANTGILIEKGVKTKFYMSAFWIKIGEWKNTKWPSCFVLKTTPKKRETTIVNEIGDSATVVERFKTTELYIMDANHRRKILCGSFDTYEEAKDFAKEVSEIMDYPIQKFNPKRATRR